PVMGRSLYDMSNAIVINAPAIVPENVWQLAQQHLIDNKRVRPVREHKWLLQRLVSCGLCGLSFKAEGSNKHRYYHCRGTMKYRHLDGSPRCTAPRIRAEWLEEQVWRKIEVIVDDPNTLQPLLKDAVTSLRRREEERRARIVPIDGQLSRITEQKSRLADDFVKLNLDMQKYQEMQRHLNEEESRLKSIRHEVDPAQIAELESTRDLILFWQKQSRYLDLNLTDCNGRMEKMANQPHKTVLELLDLDLEEVSELMQFPSTRRELLDKLQVKLISFDDRIEVKSVFPIKPIISQKCTSS
ncbi:zinc ribbon domain-containing protein, partial [Chloroflexota bacterium]